MLKGIFFNQSQWCIEWTGFDCSQITEIVFLMLPSGPLTPTLILAWVSAEVPSCHSVYLRQDGYLAHTNRTEGTNDVTCGCCGGARMGFCFMWYQTIFFFPILFSRLYVWQSGEALLRRYLRGAWKGGRWVLQWLLKWKVCHVPTILPIIQ